MMAPAIAQTTYRYPNSDASYSPSSVGLCPNAAGTLTVDCATRNWAPVTGRQTITSLSAAAALTVPSGATIAIISVAVSSVPINWTAEPGSPPTTSAGQRMFPGQPVVFNIALSNLRFIQVYSGTAQIDVEYFKPN